MRKRYIIPELRPWYQRAFLWTIIFFTILGFIRGHWNGTLGLFVLCLLMATRFDKQDKKIDFFPQELREKGLWRYGLRRAAFSLILWPKEGMPEYENHAQNFLTRYIGGTVFTVILLFFYLSILMLLDQWNSDKLAEVLTWVNQPAQVWLAPYWKSYITGPFKMVDDLIQHGYADRVPIMFHACWVSLLVGILYFFTALPSWSTVRTSHIGSYLSKNNETSDLSKLTVRIKLILLLPIVMFFPLFVLRGTEITMNFGEGLANYSMRVKFLVGRGYEESLGIFQPVESTMLVMFTFAGAFYSLALALYFPTKNTLKKYTPEVQQLVDITEKTVKERNLRKWR